MGYVPSSSLRPSACPALSRIVATRDGGLCRIKLPGGVLHAAQADAIAAASERHATGVIELTNRANVQLRGVRLDAGSAVAEALLAAGLGPQVSGDAARIAGQTAVADDVRNLMLSAAAGRDTDALHDTRPLADTLLAQLVNEPRFAALSPKFSLLLDGGEALAALDHPHDLWFSAMPAEGNDGNSDRSPRFAFGLAGQPGTRPGSALAAVGADAVPALAQALIHTFLDLATPDQTRMRDLLGALSADEIADRAAAAAGVTLDRDASVRDWQRHPASPLRRFGAWPQRQSGLHYVGAQAPLGRLDADTLRALAALSRSHAQGSLHVTPWQGVLLPDVASRDVPHVTAAFDALGLIQRSDTPLGRVVACAGATGCAKGMADTKADALALANLLNTAEDVHLTGCPRSCAAAHRAPWTLLAVAPGRYDLYRARPDAGTRHHDIGDAARFGERVAPHLSIEAIALRLTSQDRNTHHD